MLDHIEHNVINGHLSKRNVIHRRGKQMAEDLMTSHELADYLKVDLRTVYRYIKQGHIPKVKVGGRWRFRRSDIEGWLRGDASEEHLPSASGKHILVVDDHPGTVAVLTDILQEAGYNVLVAHNGEEALAMLREVHFDLLVVDLNLPKIGGLALISRAHEVYGREVRCIIVTGYASKESAIEAVNLGVQKFLEKPFSASQLLTTVKSALDEG
jgi:excisionase family DNA binding protein